MSMSRLLQFDRAYCARTAVLIFCCLALVLSFAVQGQNVTATLTGTVADATGAVIPGATVIVKNECERRHSPHGQQR